MIPYHTTHCRKGYGCHSECPVLHLWEKKQNWMGIAIDLYANGRCANQKPHLVKTCGWIATSLRFEKERDNE
jgi:hypothetical protein